MSSQRRHKGTTWALGPFCGSKTGFSANPQTKTYCCHHAGCEEKGDVTPRLMAILRGEPSRLRERLRELTPSQFERFVAGLLDRAGYDVTLTGAAHRKDGGIDLVALPKARSVGAFLLAGQIKHHSKERRTGRAAVDRLLAWKDSTFRLGLLVTNTDFTLDARWVAERAPWGPAARRCAPSGPLGRRKLSANNRGLFLDKFPIRGMIVIEKG